MSKPTIDIFTQSGKSRRKQAKEKSKKKKETKRVTINITDSTRPVMKMTEFMNIQKDFDTVQCHLSENTGEDYYLMSSTTYQDQDGSIKKDKMKHEDFIKLALESKSNFSVRKEIPVLNKPQVHDQLFNLDPEVRERLLTKCYNEMKSLQSKDRLTLDKYLKSKVSVEEEITENGKLRFYYYEDFPSEKYPYHYAKHFSTFVKEYKSEDTTLLNHFGIEKTSKGEIEYEFSPIMIVSKKTISLKDIRGYFMAPVCRGSKKVTQLHMSETIDSSLQLNQYIIGERMRYPPKEWVMQFKAGGLSKHEEKLLTDYTPEIMKIEDLEPLFTMQTTTVDIPFGKQRSPLSKFFLNRGIILMCLQQMIKTYRNRVNIFRKLKKETTEEDRTQAEKSFYENFLKYKRKNKKVVFRYLGLTQKYILIHKKFGPFNILAMISNNTNDVDRVIYDVQNELGISSFIIRESNIQSMIDNSILASSYVDLMNQSSKAFAMKLLYFLQPTAGTASMMSLTWMCQAGMSNIEDQTEKIFFEKVAEPHNPITMLKEQATRKAIRMNNVDTLFTEILFKAPQMQSEANYLRCIKKLLFKFNDDIKPTIQTTKDTIYSLMTKHRYPLKSVVFDPKDLKCDFSDFSSSSSSSDFIIGDHIRGNIYYGKHSTNYSSGSMLQMANECGSTKMKELVYFGLQQNPLIYIFVKDQTQGIREISVLNAAAKLLTQYAEMIVRPLSRASEFDYILKEETKEDKVISMFNRIKRQAEAKSKIDTEVVSITIDFSAWNQNIDLEIMAYTLTCLMEQVGYPKEYIDLYNTILKWYSMKKIEIPYTAISHLFEMYLEYMGLAPRKYSTDTIREILRLAEVNEHERPDVDFTKLGMKEKKEFAKYKKFYRLWQEMSPHVKDIFKQFSDIYTMECNKLRHQAMSDKEIHKAALKNLSNMSYIADQEEGMGQGILGTSSSIMGTVAIYSAINELSNIFEVDNFDFIETSDDCLIIAEIKNTYTEEEILQSLQEYLDVFHLKLSSVKCSVSCRPIVFFNSNRYVLENLGSRDFVEKHIATDADTREQIKILSTEVKDLERNIAYTSKLLKTAKLNSQEYVMWKGQMTNRKNVRKEQTKMYTELNQKENELYDHLLKFHSSNSKRVAPLMTSNSNIGKTYHINRYLKSMIMDNYSLMMEDEFAMHQAIMETYSMCFMASPKVGYVINTMHETNMFILRYNWLFSNYKNWSPEVSCFRPGKEYQMPHKPMPAINQASRLDFLGLIPSRNKGLIIAFPTNNQLRSKENFQRTLLQASGNVTNMMNRNPKYANEINKIIMNGGKENRSSGSILSLSKKPFYRIETTLVFPFDKFIIDEMSVQIYDIFYTMKEFTKAETSRISKLSYFTCSVPKPLTIVDFAYEHLTFKQETIHDVIIQNIGEYVSMLLDNSYIKDNSQYVPSKIDFGFSHVQPKYDILLKDYLQDYKPACEWLMPQVKVNGKYCQEGILIKYHQGSEDMYKFIYYLLDDMIISMDTYGKECEEMDMFIENDYNQLKLDSDFRISYQLNRPKWLTKTKYGKDEWIVKGRHLTHKMERNIRSFVAMDKHLRYTHDLLDIVK